jgi:hypothetical protein
MQAEAINKGGFGFVSLVGSEGWVARNQVSSSPTLIPDFTHRHCVGPLSGVPRRHRPTHCTSQREKRKFGRLRQRPMACIVTTCKLTLPSVFARDYCSMRHHHSIAPIINYLLTAEPRLKSRVAQTAGVSRRPAGEVACEIGVLEKRNRGEPLRMELLV